MHANKVTTKTIQKKFKATLSNGGVMTYNIKMSYKPPSKNTKPQEQSKKSKASRKPNISKKENTSKKEGNLSIEEYLRSRMIANGFKVIERK